MDDSLYDEVIREVYGTAEEIEREWYSGSTPGLPTHPIRPRQKQRRTKAIGLLRMDPVDRKLASILGGIPNGKAPR